MRRIFFNFLTVVTSILLVLPVNFVNAEELKGDNKLVQIKEDIKVDNLTIKEGTLVYAEYIEEEEIMMSYGDEEIAIASDKIVIPLEDELAYSPEYIEEPSSVEMEMKPVVGLYGFPHEGMAIEYIDEVEVPVYILEDGTEVVYIGNVMFFVDKEDYENKLKEILEHTNSDSEEDEELNETEVGDQESSQLVTEPEESTSSELPEEADIEEETSEQENKGTDDLLEDDSELKASGNLIEEENEKELEYFENSNVEESKQVNRLRVISNDPWEGQNTGYFKVTSDNAVVYDIRSGKYIKIGELVEGQVYPRLGQSGNYHKIRYGDYYAYVHKGHTEWSNGSGLKNENTRYSNTDRSFTATGDITVYDNTSGSFVAFGTISKGTEFAIAEDAGNFWRIIYADRVGIVYKSGTKMEFKNSDKYFEVTQNAPVYDIRSGEYVKIGELIKGESYPRVGTSGNYHMIQMGDYNGFVHISYTVLSNGSKIKNEHTNEENSRQVAVLNRDAPVYDNTSGSFVQIGTLIEGTVYKIVSESSNYVKIIFADRIGYVNKKNIETEKISLNKYDLTLEEAVEIQMKASPQTDSEYAWVSKDYIDDNSKVTADVLNVREGPSQVYLEIGELTKGAKVTIVDEVNGWYQIEYITRNHQWTHASPANIEYYLNPYNFINDEVQQFQFLDLSKASNVSVETLNNFLSGKGTLHGQGQAFIDASHKHGINDMYLVSHAILETGNGGSELARGVEVGKNKSGELVLVNSNNRSSLTEIKRVYNMFGVGANDNVALENGAKTAYTRGWTTPYKAIVGGAEFIGNNYIKAGQNTLYEMRWNPAGMESNGYATHQYATDIGWASKQIYTMYNLYQQLDSYILILDIPVYKQ